MKKVAVVGLILSILLLSGCVGTIQKPPAPEGKPPKYHTEKGLDWYRANHGSITTGTVKTAAMVAKLFEPKGKKVDIETCSNCHEVDQYCNKCHAFVGAKQQPIPE
jgi:uncharacterized protein YceK